jgi:hypothetical protein
LPRLTANRVSQAQAKSGYRRGLSQNDRAKPGHDHGGRALAGISESGVPSANGRVQATTQAASSAYPALPVTTLVTSTTASSTPTDWGRPIQPDTVPRCLTGTWSGTAALRLACSAFSPAWARHQPAMTPASVCWPARKASAAPPASAPPTSHGRRRPNRLTVRSDSAPATGLAIIATAAPSPVTQPSTATLCAGPAMSWTWLGSRTEIGPR